MIPKRKTMPKKSVTIILLKFECNKQKISIINKRNKIRFLIPYLTIKLMKGFHILKIFMNHFAMQNIYSKYDPLRN